MVVRVHAPRGTPEGGSLAHDLRERIAGEVRFDAGDRALYATDASNYRQLPIGVVVPRSIEDVVATVEVCRAHGAPLLPRGAGTSLAGQGCNVAVVIDCSKYLTRILAVDPARRLASVEPGVVLDDLREAAERHHLTYAPDPATHNRCTLGGMIGNDSCGAHSVMAGRTVDNVETLDILTPDGLRLTVGRTDEAELAAIIREGGQRGRIYAALQALRDRYADLIRARFPAIPRRVSGYNLDRLLPEHGFHVARALVGTEGTCVTVLGATVNLVPSPPVRSLVVLGYPDAASGADRVPEIMRHGPTALEGYDDHLVRALRAKGLFGRDLDRLPRGNGWLLVEFGGASKEEADDRARRLMADLRAGPGAPDMQLMPDAASAQRMWDIRESGLGGAALIPGQGQFWPGWEDSAVPPERMGAYLRDLRALLDRFGYGGAFYGHFGQGCLHTRIDFDFRTPDGVAAFRRFMEEAADLVVAYGGSLSGEHGDGQARAELLPRVFGPELVRAFEEFKAIWDPGDRMNPGKVVRPRRLDDDLRLGAAYAPSRPPTHFQFPDDDGSFAQATLRCVGVGKCRRHDAGTMCPSYMVTREELHSTRGRAHLLFELLQRTSPLDGWRDETVKEALDLCLACKGCKGECPLKVDVATYKAEFLAHYYRGKRRPVVAYSMGLIHRWARLAALAPGVANFATHAPLLEAMAKRLAGVAPQRVVPAFAPRTFRWWWNKRSADMVPPAGDRQRVLLWVDTFNNHFHPETALAAVDVLEAAGFAVHVPARALCCGRPLYDFGMLTGAKRLLRRVLDALRPEIRAGVPVVGLEPSCMSVFRDELCNLFPDDEDAQRLKRQTFMLGEFLAQRAPDFAPPRREGRAIVHGHCHHRSVLDFSSDLALLRRVGLDVSAPDSGCCGMAGAFGFDVEKYDVAMACGERVLLPAVRAAPNDAVIVADGFSCREQIAQATDRRALHLADVLRLALRGEPPGAFPERYLPDHTAAARSSAQAVAMVAAGGLTLGALGWLSARDIARGP